MTQTGLAPAADRSRWIALVVLCAGFLMIILDQTIVAGMFGMFFVGALYLQRVLGYDAIEVGLAFLPVAIGIAALSLSAWAASAPSRR